MVTSTDVSPRWSLNPIVPPMPEVTARLSTALAGRCAATGVVHFVIRWAGWCPLHHATSCPAGVLEFPWLYGWIQSARPFETELHCCLPATVDIHEPKATGQQTGASFAACAAPVKP